MGLLDTNLILAVRCPECGKINFHNVSTFKLLSDACLELNCECGCVEVTIALKDNKLVFIELPCISCDANHTYIYNLKNLLRRKVTIICCTDSGLELCFMGSEKDVRNVVQRYQEDIDALLGELSQMLDVEEDVLNLFIRKIR